jgi:hypothetical protein
MSWEDLDEMGDAPQDGMFGSEIYNSEPLAEGTQYDIDDYEDNNEYYEADGGDYDDDGYEDYYDDEDILDISDIDFSRLDGKNLKSDLKKVNRAVSNKKVVSRTKSRALTSGQPLKKVAQKPKRPLVQKPTAKPISVQKPLIKPKQKPKQKPLIQKPLIQKPTAKPIVRKGGTPIPPNQRGQKRVDIPVKRRAVIHGKKGRKTTERIYVPEDRTVIVEGVDRFMLTNNKNSESLRNIGYYKGEKLKELVLIINNPTPNDIDLELFNPSQPLDYLFSTSQNLNNVVSVAGNNLVQYTDVLFNLLANPALLPNAKFVVTGLQVQAQLNQPLIFKNKNIAGHEKIQPIQNTLNKDIDQFQNRIVYWDILQTLGRAYIPDGMDVIQYKILAGNSVVFGFYYKQVSLKRFFYTEARDKKIL